MASFAKCFQLSRVEVEVPKGCHIIMRLAEAEVAVGRAGRHDSVAVSAHAQCSSRIPDPA